jgi:Arc/MetJ-type ribon-helix-helix transcriptional regulator
MPRHPSAELEENVQFLLSSGKYVDADDVLEQAVKLLSDRERFLQLRESVRNAIDEVRQGGGHEIDERFWDELKAEADEADRLGLPIHPDVHP